MEVTEIESLIRITLDKLIRVYPFLTTWKFGFDNAKKRAGVCKLTLKEICISRYHIKNNSTEVVLDTLLHELAHAIAYELYREKGHGKCWQKVAIDIGAKPNATGDFILPESPWALVTYCEKTETVQKIASRYRRNRKIKDYLLKGKPDTKGKLYYLKSKEFELFNLGKMDFEQLNFIQ